MLENEKKKKKKIIYIYWWFSSRWNEKKKKRKKKKRCRQQAGLLPNFYFESRYSRLYRDIEAWARRGWAMIRPLLDHDTTKWLAIRLGVSATRRVVRAARIWVVIQQLYRG